MSLENIINYAMKTPANTNPAVMSSVISKSFEETSNKIKQDLYESGGVGYTETENKTLCSVALQYMSDLNASVGAVTELINLTESENYNVQLDSGSYIAKCKVFAIYSKF